MSRGERPSIEDLRALLAVAEFGTETGAGKKLGISQPVVHKRLAAFRGAVPLVETREGEIRLTPAGRAALPAVRALLRQYEQLKAFAAARRPRARGLSLAIGASSCQHYLARALAILRDELADCQIQTRVVRGRERIAGVVAGQFDLAIVSHSPLQIETIVRNAAQAERNLCRSEPQTDQVPSDSGGRTHSLARRACIAGLEVVALARLPLCVIARQRTMEAEKLHAMLSGHCVPLSMLAQWTLAGLDRESGIRQQLEARLPPDAKLTFIAEAGGWLGIKEFVKQGLCVGILPLAMLSLEDTGMLAVRRLEDNLAIAHRMIHRADADNDALQPAKQALLTAARQHEEEVERRWHGKL
jgi:DNA-binding transcriptional LysR family regulator